MRSSEKSRSLDVSEVQNKDSCDNEVFNKLVGNRPVISAVITGIPTTCLIDTGSMVSLMSEQFFFNHIKPSGVNLREPIEWLKLKAANGLELPCIGYVEIDIVIQDQTLLGCGMLVKRRDENCLKENHSVLLGMNVLNQISDFQSVFNGVCNRDFYENVSKSVKIAGNSPVCIKAFGTSDVRVTGVNVKDLSVVEPVDPSLLQGVAVTPTLVIPGDVTCNHIKVLNPGDTDVWLRPKTHVGVLSPVVDLHLAGFDVSFKELTVGEVSVEFESTSSLSTDLDPRLVKLAENPELSVDQQEQVLQILHKYKTVFALDDILGLTSRVQHRIITEDEHPIRLPYRRIHPSQLSEVKEHITQLLKRKVISESDSPYASPIVLVRNKSGQLRMCIDYRKLNGKTKQDAFPIPRIEETLDNINGSKLFFNNRLTVSV